MKNYKLIFKTIRLLIVTAAISIFAPGASFGQNAFQAVWPDENMDPVYQDYSTLREAVDAIKDQQYWVIYLLSD